MTVLSTRGGRHFAAACCALVLAACGTDDASDASDGADTSVAGSASAVATTSTAATAATDSASAAGDGEQRFPDVIDASAQEGSTGWTFSATISSPYDTPQRYADAWRVIAPDGEVLGVRELTHDHAAEQPFTRSLSGVEVPDGVAEVTIEARDLQYGWGGATVAVELPAP